MYNPKDIIEIIAGNVRKTKNPFGIPKFLVNRWYKGLHVPRTGDAMLFTGLMYQFGPYIEKSTGYLAKYEDTTWADFIRFAGYVPSYLSGLGLAMITPGGEKKKFNAILRNIADILKASRVDFYYRPDLDDYSGVLLYDLGDQEGFVQHARYVAQKLNNAGIKKLITVDPHTTYALKVLFPKYTGIRFEVKTYFELVDFQSKKRTPAHYAPRPLFLWPLPRACRCAGKSVGQIGHRVCRCEKFRSVYQLLRRTGGIHITETFRRGGQTKNGRVEFGWR